MLWSKLLVGKLPLLKKRHEMQKIVNVGGKRVWRTSTGAKMTHETGNNRNGLITLIKQFKCDIIFTTQLKTVDFHRSLAPSGKTPVIDTNRSSLGLQVST